MLSNLEICSGRWEPCYIFACFEFLSSSGIDSNLARLISQSLPTQAVHSEQLLNGEKRGSKTEPIRVFQRNKTDIGIKRTKKYFLLELRALGMMHVACLAFLMATFATKYNVRMGSTHWRQKERKLSSLRFQSCKRKKNSLQVHFPTNCNSYKCRFWAQSHNSNMLVPFTAL